MKSPLFPILSIMISCAGWNCSSSAYAKNVTDKKISEVMQRQNVPFIELKRSNKNVDLKEVTILTTFKETLDLYSKLDEKKFSRSEPIPTLEEDEFLVVLKPILRKEMYGDIEITEIKATENEFSIYYKEIANSEYAINHKKNPILILKVKGKIPSGVLLINN